VHSAEAAVTREEVALCPRGESLPPRAGEPDSASSVHLAMLFRGWIEAVVSRLVGPSQALSSEYRYTCKCGSQPFDDKGCQRAWLVRQASAGAAAIAPALPQGGVTLLNRELELLQPPRMDL
jgi:hypothetical protein